MSVPSHLKYTKEHEWVLIEGEKAKIGITDYAQDALGDIVFIQLPDVGRTVGADESFSEIESTKSVNDVYAPLSGTVASVNEALRDRPELLNSDPYGEGWICELAGIALDSAALMSAEEYTQLIGG